VIRKRVTADTEPAFSVQPSSFTRTAELTQLVRDALTATQVLRE
jgi:hypothetical protein